MTATKPLPAPVKRRLTAAPPAPAQEALPCSGRRTRMQVESSQSLRRKRKVESTRVKSEGPALGATSRGETGGLYPTPSGEGLYGCPAEVRSGQGAGTPQVPQGPSTPVCQRGESCHSSSPPKADAFAQSIKKYHLPENFPALDTEIANAEVKWFYLSPDANADHTGITGETKVKSYGPFYNVGGGDVAKGMTYVNFYKVPPKNSRHARRCHQPPHRACRHRRSRPPCRPGCHSSGAS